MPKEDAGDGLMLEEELDAASIFNPLKPDSQSSQLDTQGCSVGFYPRGRRSEDTATLQRGASHDSTL